MGGIDIVTLVSWNFFLRNKYSDDGRLERWNVGTLRSFDCAWFGSAWFGSAWFDFAWFGFAHHRHHRHHRQDRGWE